MGNKLLKQQILSKSYGMNSGSKLKSDGFNGTHVGGDFRTQVDHVTWP